MSSMDCNSDLRVRIVNNLSTWRRSGLKDLRQGLRQAAVALCVVDYQEQGGVPGLLPASRESGALVLTRRSSTLRHHAGQWALPGGRVDASESPEHAALRELGEEVGLVLTEDRVLGSLDDFATRSGYVITPVVVWGGPKVVLSKNEQEVSSIHRIPLAELLRSDAPLLEPADGQNPVLFMPIGNSCIAAPTAAILYQFREVALLGRETRVDHYEQPLFAWR